MLMSLKFVIFSASLLFFVNGFRLIISCRQDMNDERIYSNSNVVASQEE
jgi:hypothetical protein